MSEELEVLNWYARKKSKHMGGRKAGLLHKCDMRMATAIIPDLDPQISEGVCKIQYA